jgi:hypothetical protein
MEDTKGKEGKESLLEEAPLYKKHALNPLSLVN